jgi:hypothetical protein
VGNQPRQPAAAELCRCGASVLIARRRRRCSKTPPRESATDARASPATSVKKVPCRPDRHSALERHGWPPVQRLRYCRDASGGVGMVVDVAVCPHHGVRATAQTGAAVRHSRRRCASYRPNGGQDGVSLVAVALDRFATDSLRKYPAGLGARLRRPSHFSTRGRLTSTDGSSPCSHLRSPGRLGSTLTLHGALDNWTPAWPPPDLAGAATSRARSARH